MELINKKDLNTVLKIWKKQLSGINDCDIEDLAQELLEKGDEFFEKDKEDKATEYQELGEKLQELATCLQDLYGMLQDHID